MYRSTTTVKNLVFLFLQFLTIAVSYSLEGKVALVTGSSGGIGKGIALELAKHGVRVCVHYNSREEGALDTKRQLGNDKCLGVLQCDFLQLDKIPEFMQKVNELCGGEGIDILVNNAEIYVWEVAERSSKQIDESNILVSTMECFQESIEKVAARLPDDVKAYSIVDGKKGPKLSIDLPSRPWVKGDLEVYSVSLASILAKVSLDRLAPHWHKEFPDYGFDVHKGYATRDHIEAIHRFGPCRLHRLSFKSLKGR